MKPSGLIAPDPPPASRSIWLTAGIVIMVAIFTGLGIWQLERRVGKLALIERVEVRIHADPVAAPGPAEWPAVTAAADEYLRVHAVGRFRHDEETMVQAVTEVGPGFWVMTPLVTNAGFTVLVNRGFVPSDKRDLETRLKGQAAGDVSVTGLLRLTEPRGGFLRSNDPAANRWYSRDVVAIASARGIGAVAPYFIDADDTPNPGGWPLGGLTVIRFPNNHLVYALTWFSLAIGLVAATVAVRRRGSPD